MESKESLFHRIIHSFKPASRIENESIDMNKSNQDKNDKNNTAKDETGLHHSLESRHLQMIAIGGAIGSGLFVSSGTALSTGGPGAVVLGYIIVGCMLYNVCMALGELSVLFPVHGSFTTYSSRFLDPAWGFAMGWNYAINGLILLPLELTIVGMVINYWTKSINIAVWITVFLILILLIHLFDVRAFGEIEYFLSIIKVIAILGFNILAVVVIFGGGPNHEYFGLKYWYNPGTFAHGFKGFCSVFVTASFSFASIELVGLASAESIDPQKAVPRAIKQVFWRITLLYIISLALVCCLVPYNSPRLLHRTSKYDASASPFVIALENAGIEKLSSVFNAVIICAILSVGNCAVYAVSRTLCALAEHQQAPNIFAYIDRKGRPLSAIILSMLMGLMAYINCANIGVEMFNWLLSFSGLSCFFTWGSICACHIMFRLAWKAQGHSLDELTFAAPFGIWGSIFGLLVNILCLIAQFYVSISPIDAQPSAKLFFQAYLSAPIIFIFYIVWKVWKRSPFMRPSTIDLVTGRCFVETQQLIPK
ncbi:hypothetical protein I4U23_003522 [Adineta vaga]|nr:hypothetical protein I4U23_003522 [Adineta vaga]